MKIRSKQLLSPFNYLTTSRCELSFLYYRIQKIYLTATVLFFTIHFIFFFRYKYLIENNKIFIAKFPLYIVLSE